ncbi:hypothetical protein TMRH483_02580 [Qipengyuania sp. 483]
MSRTFHTGIDRSNLAAFAVRIWALDFLTKTVLHVFHPVGNALGQSNND